MGHAHGVDSGISTEKCRKVKQRFADRPVTLISLDRNQDLQHIGEKVLKASIERAKEFIKLGHASDGTSAKVNPNDLPQEVTQSRTIEQIGNSLTQLGPFGVDLGRCIPATAIADAIGSISIFVARIHLE